MGRVIIQNRTTTDPITIIGEEAGICWGTDITNPEKNYKRGLGCIKDHHGRTFEFAQVYMTLDGYSARVMREFYTHIGGGPTRLQESTRYIDYTKDHYEYVTPYSIKQLEDIYGTNPYEESYDWVNAKINETIQILIDAGVPKEDAAMLLPLGMKTKVVVRTNMRNLVEMSHVRLCNRAYVEFRQLMNDIKTALSEYSPEWKTVTDMLFIPNCEYLGYCPEKHSCGKHPNSLDAVIRQKAEAIIKEKEDKLPKNHIVMKFEKEDFAYKNDSVDEFRDITKINNINYIKSVEYNESNNINSIDWTDSFAEAYKFDSMEEAGKAKEFASLTNIAIVSY